MANVIINDQHLTAITEAIRGKNGESTTYMPREMAAAIAAIEAGGGAGAEEVNAAYAAFIESGNNKTDVEWPEELTSIGGNAFLNCTGLATINVPWAEGEVSGAPWGATKATINYNYTGGA